ncbi:hypothetical protein PCE1_001643 [Barthelona sp. PCE]
MLLSILAFLGITLVSLIIYIRVFRHQKGAIAFFHPFANDGGGGERVLFFMIKAIQESLGEKANITVFTGKRGDETPEDILQKAYDVFGIKLHHPVNFIFIKTTFLCEHRHFPFLTLFLQSVFSMFTAFECLLRMRPDYVIDSMGYAFTYPVFKLVGGCRVGCYTHYPTISMDMITVVKTGQIQYNNRPLFARLRLFVNLKLVYYKTFARLYRWVSYCCDHVMVNSSWTESHVEQLWGRVDRKIHKVFPPCDTAAFEALPFHNRSNTIVSVGQFRPEKNHRLILDAFAAFLEDTRVAKDTKLVLIGSCRAEADHELVSVLKSRAKTLGISDNLEILVNIPFSELLKRLGEAKVGIHAMVREHFGIAVVEYLAAGLYTIAHNSGGPKQDIVKPGCGQLAESEEEYAEFIRMGIEEECVNYIRSQGREHASMFSQEAFVERVKDLYAEDNFFNL